MAAMSDHLEELLLNLVLTNPSWTAIPTIYVALFDETGTGLETGSLTGEISGGSYARTSVTFANAVNPDGTSKNSLLVEFPQATADWVTGGANLVTYAALMDAATLGNVLFHTALSQPKDVKNGDTFQFDIDDLVVSLT